MAPGGRCGPPKILWRVSAVNILSVAFPLLTVGPDSGGGAEQILYLLERRLVALGHRSFVIAAEGSEISGSLIPSPAADGEITSAVRCKAQSIHRELIESLLRKHAVDVIHFHGLDFHAYVPFDPGHVAMLATLHLPVAWYPDEIFRIPAMLFNCVSQHQAVGVTGRRLPFITNGVDLSQYKTWSQPREHLLFMARICPEKGVDAALRVARQLDLPLLVAGPVHPFRTHQEYFTHKVYPLLDRKRRYLGPVGLAQKTELLAGAQAVLIPSLASETSSLVAMEAASAGTPVIAYRSGALPEVIADGQTGFIVESEQEMAEAVGRVPTIFPDECRKRACKLFDADRMAAQYIELYSQIVQDRPSCSNRRT
jgi:glycosyltransferase involved in cell wall biosynthesis